MIRYRLTCKNCNNFFDSWFSSSKEYDKLKKTKHLNCHYCGSIKVEKTLMAPNIMNSKNDNITTTKDKKYIKIKNKIKEYQKFIKKNFDYVGDNFAYEARSLHYDDKKKSKGIYGKASIDEISDLKNEGIETDVIPWFHNEEN
tara:strand:- start:383 stop:811 length:429 start_codon:yes stop_codon:yes gene_type:complete